MKTCSRTLWSLLSLFFFSCLLAAGAESELTTYTNEAWGYSITYPETYILLDDKSFLKETMEKGLEGRLDSSEESELIREQLKRTTGQQFALFAPGLAEEPTANLIMAIERVQASGISNQTYFAAAVSQMSKIQATLLDEASTVDIQGKEFYTQAYDISGPEGVLRGRILSHYDSSERIAYLFSITGRAEQDVEELKALAEILQTFTVHDVGEDIDGQSASLCHGKGTT